MSKNAFGGNFVFVHGKWIMNCMPLIRPQIWFMAPDMIV